MRPLLTSSLPLLVALLAASSGGQSASPTQGADAPDDLAKLVPQDALIYVQLESLEKLDEISAMLSEQTGSPVALGEDVRSMIGAQLDGAQVDETRPVGMTADPMQMMMGGSPVSAVLLPAKDAGALAGSLRSGEGGPQAETEGSYVAVPQGRSFKRGSAPSALTQSMLPGAVSARVELGTLLESLRPMIDAGLEQAMMMMGSFGAGIDTGGVDIEELMQLYIDGLGIAMDSADVLDLALDTDGTEMAFAVEFLAQEGSEMAEFVKDSKGGTGELAGFLDVESDIQMFMNGDMGAVFDEFMPVMDDLMGFYPEDFQDAFDAYLPAYTEMMQLLGNELAMNMNWGPEGISIDYFMAADDPAELMASFTEMLSADLGAGIGLSVGPMETVELEGLEVTRSVLEIDYEKLAMLSGSGQPLDSEQMVELMESMYGGNKMELAFATSGGVLALHGGAVGTGFEATMKRLQAGPGEVRKELAGELAATQEGRLGGFMRMDLASYMAMVMQSTEALLEDQSAELPDFSGKQAMISMDFSLVGLAWRGGVSMDMAEVSELMNPESQAVELEVERK